MKVCFLFFFFLTLVISPQKVLTQTIDIKARQDELVTAMTRIYLPDYPYAHNPSIIDTEQGLVLTFRWVPDPAFLFVSLIGIVRLNESLEPI